MDASSGRSASRTAEDVFTDFRSRRAGIIKALTSDVKKFYKKCDPEKENLCLYGLADETWEVNMPAEEVPPELPEPVLGINFARDGMEEKDWLTLVAVHSDAWLISVAFYFAARFNFDRDTRMRLFTMINDLPTIYEAVTGRIGKPREKTPMSTKRSDKPSSQASSLSSSKAKPPRPSPVKEEESNGEDEEEDDDHENTLCGACGMNYANDEFWICCDVCENWFHGKCVKITPARAEHIKHYKCPTCITKRFKSSHG